MRYEKLKGKYDGTSMRFSWFWILNSNFQFCKFKTRVYNHFKSKNFFHFFRQINNKQYENTIISPIKTWKRKKRRKKKKRMESATATRHDPTMVTPKQPPPPWLGYPATMARSCPTTMVGLPSQWPWLGHTKPPWLVSIGMIQPPFLFLFFSFFNFL